MEGALKPYLGFFFPGECYEELVVKLNFLDVKCLNLLNSRLMSFGIILGSLMVKVPQIIKIVRASSVESLSYLTFLLELAAVTFTCSYSLAKGFPFSAWGESFFISVQVVILLALMFYYNGHLPYLAVFVPVYAAIVWYTTSGLAPMQLLSALQASVIPAMIGSRLSQIAVTFMNGTTGQLSLITSLLSWLGSGSRIFTTLQETGDTLMLITFSVAFVLNSIIMLQFVIYWNVSTAADKRKKET